MTCFKENVSPGAMLKRRGAHVEQQTARDSRTVVGKDRQDWISLAENTEKKGIQEA